MTARLILGNVFDTLPTIAPGSVDCCVTSPPYFALRSYLPKDHPLKPLELGSEPTPEAYVENMVRVFGLVRKALAEHATCWVNIGDTYNCGTTAPQPLTQNGADVHGWHTQKGQQRAKVDNTPGNLCLIPQRFALALQADGWVVRSVIVWHKPAPMPASVAGWRWQRCRIKTGNRKPIRNEFHQQRPALEHESSRGHHKEAQWSDCPGCPKCEKAGGFVLRRGSWRPTSAWEPILMLAKSERYFADGEGVKTPLADSSLDRQSYGYSELFKSVRRASPNDEREHGEAVGPLDNPPSGANLRDVWTIAAEPLKEKHYACVDAETECLTAAGWKRHDEITPGELVAQFDMQSERMVWGPVYRVFTYHVKDEDLVMMEKAKRLSVAFTKEHRCVIKRRTSPSPVFIEARDLKNGHQLVTHAPWDYAGTRPFDDTFAELLGWYIAEGYEHKCSPAVSIYQSVTANAPFVARIEELLKAVRAEYEFASYKRLYRGRETLSGCFRIKDFIAYKLREVAPGKEMPGDCLLWDASLIEAFLRGLIDGDGHTRTSGRRWFTQKNKRTVDFLQAMMIRTGHGATVLHGEGDMWQVSSASVKAWSLRGTNGAHLGVPLARYSGVVWCVSTDKGTWMARRKGKHFVTGNSFPTELVHRCLKAGTSAKGYCPECGKPWARVVESRPSTDGRAGGTWDGMHEQISRGGPSRNGNFVDAETKTIGWRPSCSCPEQPPRPGLVLDPFAGSGRTGIEALRLGLDFIGCELNEVYVQMATRLLREESPLFAGGAT